MKNRLEGRMLSKSNDITEISSWGSVPRLAMANDISGFGRCSTTVSLPVISVMGVQVCPIPTAILSNHLAYPYCCREDFTSRMKEYMEVWKRLEISFDGFYCGFLTDTAQFEYIQDFLDFFMPPVFLLDPVMGDHGKPYSSVTKEHCDRLKELAKKAHILTPNLTESCLLTDTPYKEYWTEAELDCLCQELKALCPGKIVITGLEQNNIFTNICLYDNKKITCSTPKSGASRPGTGDLFASILAADAVLGRDFYSSVKKASEFVALCIKSSEEEHIPVKEGVLFEKHLRELLCQS